MQAVWDRLVDVGAHPEVTEAQKADLDRRLAALEANPNDVVSWEAIKDYVRRAR